MIVYKVPGKHRGNKGTTFDWKGCEDSEVDALVAKGWFKTLAEAEKGKTKLTITEIDQNGDEVSDEVIFDNHFAPEIDEETLLDQFKEDPESLTKRQHIELGKSLGLSLTMSYKESTMIEKIKNELD